VEGIDSSVLRLQRSIFVPAAHVGFNGPLYQDRRMRKYKANTMADFVHKQMTGREASA
jgi:hypothetical protein